MAPRSSTPRPPMPRLWCRRKSGRSGRSRRSSETSSSGRGWCETWFRGGLYYWYLLITTNNRKILITNQYIPVSWDGRKVFFMFCFLFPWEKNNISGWIWSWPHVVTSLEWWWMDSEESSLNGRMITAIFRFMNYHNSARYLKLLFPKIYGDRYPHAAYPLRSIFDGDT